MGVLLQMVIEKTRICGETQVKHLLHSESITSSSATYADSSRCPRGTSLSMSPLSCLYKQTWIFSIPRFWKAGRLSFALKVYRYRIWYVSCLRIGWMRHSIMCPRPTHPYGLSLMLQLQFMNDLSEDARSVKTTGGAAALKCNDHSY